ncbi:helix-turn-helix domain-containing protein [Streptomyces sp. NPDC059070]|uniref:MmyB family transcriptional regulator n=1 Tax=Streptomyces sp. NPDC059070 TaxID=3346713 RepID=UPI0036D07E7A
MTVSVRGACGTGNPARAGARGRPARPDPLQELIRGRRDHLGLSQETVAERLGVSSRAYGNWERGRVKEWTDGKLLALADVLEMTDYQVERLFRLTVGRPPARVRQPHPQGGRAPGKAEAAFLADYDVLMDALSLPALLMDHRWQVRAANDAYRDLFTGLGTDPRADPAASFLRFGLLHPEAGSLLVNHADWRISLLSALAAAREQDLHDPGLRALHADVHRRPSLRALCRDAVDGCAPDGAADPAHPEGPLRVLRHPDPRRGLQICRLVEEVPTRAHILGLTRLTFVLTPFDFPCVAAPPRWSRQLSATTA